MTGNIVGVFILGMLTGWLVEWLFITFIMAKPKTPQVTSMKSDQKTDHMSNNGNDHHHARSTSAQETEVIMEKAPPSQPQSARPITDEMKKSVDNVVVKEVVIKEKQVGEHIEEHVKASNNTKEKTHTTTATTESKKEQQEKPEQPEQPLVSSEQDSEDDKTDEISTAVEESKPIQQDDFMRLKGIGPKLAESIKKTKISRYDELSVFTGEELIAKLEASGAIIVNRPAFTHIPKQAALAAKGDWEALEALKKSI